MTVRHICALVLALLVSVASSTPASAIECAFRNPIIPFGQDPSVVYVDGMYYLVQANTGTITLTASATLTGLGRVQPVPIFSPPPAQQYSYDLWAPELFHHEGEWYVYFAATSALGVNETHRMFVISADTDDPLGSWSYRGRIYDPENDYWAIDGAVFEWDDQLYMIWSGWETREGDFPQNLYIAPMSDPVTLSGERVLITEPDQPWEMTVAPLVEGPQPFIHEGTLSIVYSADASWTAAYSLGLLHLTGDDVLDSKGWVKRGPIFDRFEGSEGSVYGPGHNAFPVPSPDGTESWLVYHAIATEFGGWEERGIRAQPFTWGSDETPVFGDPVPTDVPLELPAGEPCGLLALTAAASAPAAAATPTAGETYVLNGTPIELGAGLLNTTQSFSAAAWVRLERLDVPMAFISQEGGLNSSFALEYVDGAFAFTYYAPLGTGVKRATAADDARQPGTWVHVAGVYDLADDEARLYINGALTASARDIFPWDARGAALLGAVRQGGQRIHPLYGTMRDVRLYAGALNDAEIARLYQGAAG